MHDWGIWIAVCELPNVGFSVPGNMPWPDSSAISIRHDYSRSRFIYLHFLKGSVYL